MPTSTPIYSGREKKITGNLKIEVTVNNFNKILVKQGSKPKKGSKITWVPPLVFR